MGRYGNCFALWHVIVGTLYINSVKLKFVALSSKMLQLSDAS